VRPDIYIVAFEAGREARIAGRPRHRNHYRALDQWFPADITEERTRLGNSWDAGWLFAERAARRIEKAHDALAVAIMAVRDDITKLLGERA
jgi:hypothetical protein